MKGVKVMDVLLGALVLCALVITGLVVRREVAGSGQHGGKALTRVDAWSRYATSGQRLGPADARVTIVEFSDFQCPSCKKLAGQLEHIRKQYPRDVAVVYRHYPLDPIHPHARQAALASECAAAQGRFEAFHDILFGFQDEIGSRAWLEFAGSAGVQDLDGFEQCLAEGMYAERVEADMAAARELEIGGTPLVLINSLKFHGTPPLAELQEMVDAALAR